MNEKMIVDFNNEGVVFTIPSNLRDVYVLKMSLKNPKTSQAEFKKAKRPIINFKIIKLKSDGKAEPVTKFRPSLMIEVHYKRVDDDNAGGANKKKLAFYDDKNKKWTLITKNKHKFEPKPYKKNDPNKKANFKGYGIAEFDELPDPVIGWGP